MISSLLLSVLISSGIAGPEAPKKKKPQNKIPYDQLLSLKKETVYVRDFMRVQKRFLDKQDKRKRCFWACTAAAERQYRQQYYGPIWAKPSSDKTCRLKLVDDWMKKVTEKKNPDADIGKVTCGYTLLRPIRGRLPVGNQTVLVEPLALATVFARAAQEEALSVFAFQQLANRLSELGAPHDLIVRCFTAASEERQHAAIMLNWAIDSGAVLPPLTLPQELPCSLFELALHNAVQGLINESWAALLASVSAANAPVEMRQDLRCIADDELSHADLAYDVHVYLMGLLTEVERSAVESAMVDALQSVSNGLTEPHVDCLAVGEPSLADQERLLGAFQHRMQSILG